MPSSHKITTRGGLPALILDGPDLAFLTDTGIRNYIAETWRKSMQRDSIYAHQLYLRRDAIWSRIERVLKSPLTRVTLALWPESGGEGGNLFNQADDTPQSGELFVLGWMVGAPSLVHYVYVRERYRQVGVMDALLNYGVEFERGAPLPCSHWSTDTGAYGFRQLKAGPLLTYAGVDWSPSIVDVPFEAPTESEEPLEPSATQS